jgi:Nse4 C-terminal
MVKHVAQILKEKSPINLFEFVINPTCFAQTVENVFYLSFSVRDARARIEMKDGAPIVHYVDTLTEAEQLNENKQLVLEMSWGIWEVCLLCYNADDRIWLELSILRTPSFPIDQTNTTEKVWLRKASPGTVKEHRIHHFGIYECGCFAQWREVQDTFFGRCRAYINCHTNNVALFYIVHLWLHLNS